MGELLRQLTERIEAVSKTATTQGNAAGAITGGVREMLSGAEQAAGAATRAAAAVEEVAALMRELQDALEQLRY